MKYLKTILLSLVLWLLIPTNTYADDKPPTMEIVTGSPASPTEAPYRIKVKFTDDDGVSTITFQNSKPLAVDGIKQIVASYTVNASGTYSVTVTDTVGNSITYSIEVKNIIGNDTTAPVITVLQGNPDKQTSGTVAVKFKATDNVGIDRIECNGSKENVGGLTAYTYTYYMSKNGVITFTVYDTAGNYATKSIEVTQIIDENETFEVPTTKPTQAPTVTPTQAQTQRPTTAPTQAPTVAPTQAPTQASTQASTIKPVEKDTQPTKEPVTKEEAEQTSESQKETETESKLAIAPTVSSSSGDGTESKISFKLTKNNRPFYICLISIFAIGAIYSVGEAISQQKRIKVLKKAKEVIYQQKGVADAKG